MLSDVKELLSSAMPAGQDREKLDELAPLLEYDPAELDYSTLKTSTDVKRLKQLLKILE